MVAVEEGTLDTGGGGGPADHVALGVGPDGVAIGTAEGAQIADRAATVDKAVGGAVGGRRCADDQTVVTDEVGETIGAAEGAEVFRRALAVVEGGVVRAGG